MAQAFPRTTRALAAESRLWPLSFVVCGLVLLCAWGLWFAAAGLPAYADSDSLRLAGEPGLRTVRLEEGGTVRYRTHPVWPVRASVSGPLAPAIETGQPAVLRLDLPHGRVLSLAATVTEVGERRPGAARHVGLAVVSDEPLDALFADARAAQARIVVGRQSPLFRVLTGSGLGVTSVPVTAVSQRP